MWACANFRTTRFCRWATRQWRSHRNTHKTFPSKSFSLRFLLNGSLFLLLGCNLSYIVDSFAGLHELASASAGTLLKLALSVRTLLKPYGDTLKTFALIVTAHLYCARKFICHVMHWARALSTKMINDRACGHCYSFAWIQRSWTFGDPCFSFQKQISFTIISTLSNIEQKSETWFKNSIHRC